MAYVQCLNKMGCFQICYTFSASWFLPDHPKCCHWASISSVATVAAVTTSPAYVGISSQGLNFLCLSTEHAHHCMRNDWMAWAIFPISWHFFLISTPKCWHWASNARVATVAAITTSRPRTNIISRSRYSLSAHWACTSAYAQWLNRMVIFQCICTFPASRFPLLSTPNCCHWTSAATALLPLPPLLPPPSHVRISSQGLRRSLSAHRACAASYAQWPRVCKAFCHAPTAPARTQRSLFPLSQFEGGSKVKFTGIVQCTYEIYKYFGHSNFFFQQKFQYWSQYWNLQKCLLILSVCFKCMSCPGFWSAEHNSRKRVAWFVIHRCVLNKILGTRYTQPFRQNFDLQST